MEENAQTPSLPPVKPSALESAEGSAKTSGETLPTPRLPADIPGLGPIRVRALQKAGLGDLEILRAASLTTLTAVPGMSDIKARHILAYLAQFPAEALRAAATVKPVVCDSESEAAPAEEQVSTRAFLPLPDLPKPSGTSLKGEAMLAANLAVSLLTSEPAYEFRERLLREMTRFARLARSFAGDTVSLNGKDQERLQRRLARALSELTEAATDGAPDRKAQSRLADALEEASERLSESIRPTGGKAPPVHA